MNLQTRGEGFKKSEIFADVINGSPLKTISHPMTEMASRILQVGPVGSKFLGPIVIDVPHVASLRSGVRETAILRCDSASEGKWVEHKQKALEDSLKVSH